MPSARGQFREQIMRYRRRKRFQFQLFKIVDGANFAELDQHRIDTDRSCN